MFQVSKDGHEWLTLHTHIEDTSLGEPGSTASWHVIAPEDPQGWRHVRIKLSGPNASGQTHYISMSGLELYGEIKGLADDDLGQLGREGGREGGKREGEGGRRKGREGVSTTTDMSIHCFSIGTCRQGCKGGGGCSQETEKVCQTTRTFLSRLSHPATSHVPASCTQDTNALCCFSFAHFHTS